MRRHTNTPGYSGQYLNRDYATRKSTDLLLIREGEEWPFALDYTCGCAHLQEHARLRVLLDAGNALERWAAGAIVDYTMDGEPTVAGGGSYYTFYMEENGGYIDERWAADAEFAKWCCMCEVSAGNECEVCAQGRTRSYIVTELPEEG